MQLYKTVYLKTFDVIDGRLLHDAADIKLDVDNFDCYQELFSFATGHVICNDDDAVKFTEGEENGLSFVTSHNAVLKTTCDSALDICAVYSVDHLLDQQLTRPNEPEEEEQISDIRQHS